MCYVLIGTNSRSIKLITEATVSKWLKNQGESVKLDEPVVELETDKVNVEVPSPAEGILSIINFKNGDTVEVGALLGSIGVTSEKIIPINKSKKYQQIKDIFKKMHLNVTEIKTLNEHDNYMSLIQGMTHFSHVCFTTAMKKLNLDLDKIMEICSPIYLSNISFSSRITGGDENLYTNIIMDNPKNNEVLKLYLETSKKLFNQVVNKDYSSFKDNFIDNRNYLKKHLSKMIKQSDFLVNKMAEFKSGSKD